MIENGGGGKGVEGEGGITSEENGKRRWRERCRR